MVEGVLVGSGSWRTSHTGAQGDDYEGRTSRLVMDGTGCLWKDGDRVGSWHAGYKRPEGAAWRRPSEDPREQEDKACWTPIFGTFRRWP